MTDYTPEQVEHIELECNAIDCDELYADYIDEMEPEVIIAGTYIGMPSDILREHDSVAWNEEVNNYIDGLVKDGQLIEIGDDFYNADDVADAMETFEDEPKPNESDAFMQSTGPLGSKTSAYVDGKYLGIFDTDAAALKAIRAHCDATSYWPNIWQVSDHGNHHLVEELEK